MILIMLMSIAETAGELSYEWLKASRYYHSLPGLESAWVEVRLRA